MLSIRKNDLLGLMSKTYYANGNLPKRDSCRERLIRVFFFLFLNYFTSNRIFRKIKHWAWPIFRERHVAFKCSKLHRSERVRENWSRARYAKFDEKK